jgi:lipid-A-disaccharide synthase-like uncharacterized protein
VPENNDATSKSHRFARRRRVSVAPREAVMGLDTLEWRVSLLGAGVALIMAIVTAIQWIRNVPIVTTQNPTKSNSCPQGFHLAHSLCKEVLTSTRSAWEVKFFFILVVGLCLLYFTIRRKRAGVACFTVFLGFGLGVGPGLIFFAIGAWLIMRAFRLQKYGEASFFGSNRVAKERGRAKREGRSDGRRANESAKSAASERPTRPEPSKRYTPKKQPRRR